MLAAAFALAMAGWRSVTLGEDKPKAAAAPMKAFKVAGHGDLLVAIPAGWTDELQTPPPTLIVTPADAKQCKATLTIVGDPGCDSQFNASKAVREIVERSAADVLASAEESDLPLQPMRGGGPGFYFMLTEKAPGPGVLRHLTCGTVAIGDLMVSFTIRHRFRDSPELGEAMAMIKSVQQKARTLVVGEDGVVAIPALTRPWLLKLPAGMKVTRDESDLAKRRRVVTASDESSGLQMSVLLAAAPKLGGASDVRETWWAATETALKDVQDIHRDSVGEHALIEYRLVNGDNESKHSRLYISRDGVWIDVHVSKTQFQSPQQARLDAAVRAIGFMDAKD